MVSPVFFVQEPPILNGCTSQRESFSSGIPPCESKGARSRAASGAAQRTAYGAAAVRWAVACRVRSDFWQENILVALICLSEKNYCVSNAIDYWEFLC